MKKTTFKALTRTRDGLCAVTLKGYIFPDDSNFVIHKKLRYNDKDSHDLHGDQWTYSYLPLGLCGRYYRTRQEAIDGLRQTLPEVRSRLSSIKFTEADLQNAPTYPLADYLKKYKICF